MAILGTVVMGLIKLGFESYSLLHVDSMGRRPLLLYGAAGLTTVLALTGAALSVKLASGTPGITAASIAVVLGISAYMAFHALSYGPCTWLVLSEIFPNSVRGKAMGIATMANRMTSFYVASTFLSLSDRCVHVCHLRYVRYVRYVRYGCYGCYVCYVCYVCYTASSMAILE